MIIFSVSYIIGIFLCKIADSKYIKTVVQEKVKEYNKYHDFNSYSARKHGILPGLWFVPISNIICAIVLFLQMSPRVNKLYSKIDNFFSDFFNLTKI